MLMLSVSSIACLYLNNPKPRTTIITKLAEHLISNTEACLAQGYVSDTTGDEEQKPHGDQTHSTHRRMVGKRGDLDLNGTHTKQQQGTKQQAGQGGRRQRNTSSLKRAQWTGRK